MPHRIVSLAAHSGTGKTTLAEALLHRSGVVSRMGRVEDGTTRSDHTDAEKAHGFSIQTGVLRLTHEGTDVTVVALGASVDFARDVRPVLEQRCFECHGEKKQKNGLRLDRKAGFFAATDSGKAAVVPGKSAESSLLSRLTTEKEDEVMPPKGRKLSAAEIALVKHQYDVFVADEKKRMGEVPPRAADDGEREGDAG